MQWLRSLVFTAFLFAWSFTYAVFFVLVSWLFPVATRYRIAAWYAARLLRGLRLICGLDYEVSGLENLPRVMRHLESVTVLDDRRSRWTARAPAGTTVEWVAVIHNEIEDELLAWKSEPGASIANAGSSC